jgi:ubiquinone/menaquinone biosynthesis C-methylase UbiE
MAFPQYAFGMGSTASTGDTARQYKTSDNLQLRMDLHERFSINKRGFHRWVFDQLDLDPVASILEIGCGTGRLWRDNAARIPPGWRVTLTDFSEGMLNTARKNTEGLGFDYRVANATYISIEHAQFDAVIANHMLYHVEQYEDRQRVYSNITRILKPGGHFYAATNGLQHMHELEELVRAFDPAQPFIGSIVRNFSLESAPAELAGHFPEIRVKRYEDALRVTDAQAIVDYVLSATPLFQSSTERKAELSAFIHEHTGDMFVISKDSGLLQAVRA